MNIGLPLTRAKPWYPGQMGVPGTDTERGLRTHTTGAVFYVDPNYSGVSDLRDGTDPEDPLRTVAAALTKCQAYRGDVILVMANGTWEYAGPNDYATVVAESVIVTVPGVSIIGVCPSSPVGVPWTPAADLGWCIEIRACDVTVEGFAFVGEPQDTGARGIFAEFGPGRYGDNAVIRNCYFDSDIVTGVELAFSWQTIIEGCKFDGCGYGVYVDPEGLGAAYCDIANNEFRDCAVGAIYTAGIDDSRIHHNSVYNANAQAGAAATDEGIITTDGVEPDGVRNIVYENWLSCALPVGVGDYNDLCSGSPTDAWVQNYCMNGPATTNPT